MRFRSHPTEKCFERIQEIADEEPTERGLKYGYCLTNEDRNSLKKFIEVKWCPISYNESGLTVDQYKLFLDTAHALFKYYYSHDMKSIDLYIMTRFMMYKNEVRSYYWLQHGMVSP